MTTTWEVTGPSAVEEGVYLAELVSAEEADSEFGRRIRWRFTLPEADGHEVSRFTSTSFHEKSKAGELVAALLGRKLERGMAFTKEQLIGKRCRLVLGISDSGWNAVTGAMALPTPKATIRRAAPAPEPELADLEALEADELSA